MAVIILPDAQEDFLSLQEFMLDKWSGTEWLKAERRAPVVYTANQAKSEEAYRAMSIAIADADRAKALPPVGTLISWGYQLPDANQE